MRIELPYGKDGTVSVEVPDENLISIIEPCSVPSLTNVEAKIREAICNPIGSERLSNIVKPKDRVKIIITDISRPCPDDKLLPAILEELGRGGVRDSQVTLVVATGMHRPMTEQELREKVSDEVYDRVEIINHVCTDEKSLVFIGRTANLGIPLWVNKAVTEADVLISIGMVDTHIFAGYTGDGKSVMPGIAGLKTIESMHKPERLDSPFVGVCSYDRNPVRLDVVEAARMVGLRFIVNVAFNAKDEIAYVGAGDLVKAHREVVKFVDGIVKVPIPELPDIVISGPGYPKDRDLYQATRAANNFVCGPAPAIKEGGIIIIPAPCQDGVGGKTFHEWMRDAKDLDEILERSKREPELGAHRPYIMAKILKRADVIIVGSEIPHIVEEMKMMAAKTLDEALKMATERMGEKARILVSTHGLTTVPISGRV